MDIRQFIGPRRRLRSRSLSLSRSRSRGDGTRRNFTADRVKRNRCEDPFFFRGRVALNLTSLFSLVGKRGAK